MAKTVVRHLTIADIPVTVHQKKMKHIYLRVKAPLGEVHISAPLKASDKIIEQMVLERLQWIESKQETLKNTPVVEVEPLATGSTVFVLGTAYTVQIILDRTKKPHVELNDNLLLLYTHKNNRAAYNTILHEFYRGVLQEHIPPLIHYWQQPLGVTAQEWRIKRMKTRWGSCNTKAHRLWFNLFLAEHSIACIEYVVLHELAHLLEPSHNKRFWGIVAKHMPDWKARQKTLNQRLL